MLPSVSATPSWSRRVAILVPRWSSPILVANVTSWPKRARPTATLAGLPPTCSWAEPSGRETISISDSPITSVRVWGSSGSVVGGGQTTLSAVPAAKNPTVLAIPLAVSQDGERDYVSCPRHRGRCVVAAARDAAWFGHPAQHGHLHGVHHGRGPCLGGDGPAGP